MIILRPEPVAAIAAGAENLLTPSPKEVFVAGSSYTSVAIDLGVEREIDTFFVGFTNGSGSASIDFYRATGFGTGNVILGNTPLWAADAVGPLHGLLQLPAPIASRYFTLGLARGTAAANVQAGILMLGKRFQAPHERGGGRQLIDTGTKERLPDGGIAGEDGVMLASLRWRFVGLSDAVRRQLWALAYDRGERRPVLVIEEPDSEAAGANERIHYGTFDRFEAYERADPNQTSWALSMTEWL